MGYLPCKLCALIATIIGIGTVPVAEAGTSAQAVPTPTSGVTPVFEFNNITNMTFCAPAVISWQYHPDTSQDPFDVSLAIWNESTAQTLPFLTPYENRTSSMRRTTRKLKPSHNHIDERKKRSFNTTSQMITPSLIDPVVGSFTWGKVNVTTGWYVLVATSPNDGFASQSHAFFVQDGSCHTSIRHKPGIIVGAALGGIAILLLAAIFVVRVKRRNRAARLLRRIPLRSDSQLGTIDTDDIHLGVSHTPPPIERALQVFNTRVESDVLSSTLSTVEISNSRLQHSIPETPSHGVAALPTPVHTALGSQELILQGTQQEPQQQPLSSQGVLAFDGPMSIHAAVVESQESMFQKLEQMQRDMRRHENTPSPQAAAVLPQTSTHNDGPLEMFETLTNPEFDGLEQMGTEELARQFRVMAQRLARMEARWEYQDEEQPPEYS